MRLFLLFCVVAVALAKKHHGHKKAKAAEEAEAKEALDKLTYSKEEQIMNVPEEETETGYHNAVSHPCIDVDCGPGQNCALDAKWNPYCKCLDECPPEDSPMQMCSSQNMTYPSWCEFHRQKCIRAGTLEGIVVEYYGPCKEMTPCTDRQMKTFPHRMKEWFKNVMLELSQRPIVEGGLTEDEIQEEVESEKDANPFMRPIHWNFRRMDKNPADMFLTHEELTDLRAPLMPMEHCIKPFFTKCDTDNDGRIALQEWGLCLGLTEEEIMY